MLFLVNVLNFYDRQTLAAILEPLRVRHPVEQRQVLVGDRRHHDRVEHDVARVGRHRAVGQLVRGPEIREIVGGRRAGRADVLVDVLVEAPEAVLVHRVGHLNASRIDVALLNVLNLHRRLDGAPAPPDLRLIGDGDVDDLVGDGLALIRLALVRDETLRQANADGFADFYASDPEIPAELLVDVLDEPRFVIGDLQHFPTNPGRGIERVGHEALACSPPCDLATPVDVVRRAPLEPGGIIGVIIGRGVVVLDGDRRATDRINRGLCFGGRFHGLVLRR